MWASRVSLLISEAVRLFLLKTLPSFCLSWPSYLHLGTAYWWHLLPPGLSVILKGEYIWSISILPVKSKVVSPVFLSQIPSTHLHIHEKTAFLLRSPDSPFWDPQSTSSYTWEDSTLTKIPGFSFAALHILPLTTLLCVTISFCSHILTLALKSFSQNVF